MTLVDLGRATPGASPQECEDEMQNLQRGLEGIVSRLLLRLRRVVAGPCAEVTRPATSREAQFDIENPGGRAQGLGAHLDPSTACSGPDDRD